MSRPPALTEQQKIRLKILKAQLFDSCRKKDRDGAISILNDLRGLLLNTNHHTKYYEMLLVYCELLINTDNSDQAIKILNKVSTKTSSKTRINQESFILKSIAHLHLHEYEDFNKCIKIVFDSTAIKDTKRREEFIKFIGKRLEEECLIISLKSEQYHKIDTDKILSELETVFRKNLSDVDILAGIGKSLPPKTIDFISNINNLARMQLVGAEKLMLPPPPQENEERKLGERLLNSISRRTWLTLCEKNSKCKYIIDTLGNPGTAISTIAYNIFSTAPILGAQTIACLTAVILKQGIDKYCKSYKPQLLMQVRYSKSTQ
ncbi:hypothetical protein [Desulfovibrio subterraneus]|uniref:Uncharacterized protein n=1 Tax=Desulfovibrio subterraneus TaxID=2718620 RepID=A0A7J0BE70_9BACT|nr:hypothetical protein [Desulfovibrio subterraneus]GFM32010.1 hypothetical protein DSM101010T_03750 [Desulfovibrio subterraneus]